MSILMSTSDATPAGLHIEYYAAVSSVFSPGKTNGIYAIELPFQSRVHLIGVPNTLLPEIPVTTLRGLEPVQLEGTYNQVFHLYAEAAQQTQSRYLLDPAAMAFTIDFCSQYNWEILGDTLYFLSADKLPSFALVDEFVNQIRPVVEDPSNRQKNHHNMSYIHTNSRKLLCPVCQAQLQPGESWLACPAGHGCLITGKQLLDMRADRLPAKIPVSQSVWHSTLMCPYCKHGMKPTQYQNSNATIDVCSKCMFRWLDAEEPSKISL